MALMAEVMEKQNFASPEDAQRFLNENFTGRPMSEIARQFRSDSPRDRALNILDEIPDNCPPTRARNLLQKAIDADPGCIEALVAFAATEPTVDRRATAYERVVELGRSQCADRIASLGPSEGLWGFARARPFLEAMHHLAYARTHQRRTGEAIVLLREILALNPGDNQGVRYDLLTLLVARGRFQEALSLIDAYHGDGTCYWRYSRALVHFFLALVETGFDISDGPSPEPAPLGEAFRFLPAEFVAANRLLDEAIADNPFVGRFVYAGAEALSALEWPPHYALGSPDEAFLYAAKNVEIWREDDRPFLWLLWRCEVASAGETWHERAAEHEESLARYEKLLKLAENRVRRRR